MTPPTYRIILEDSEGHRTVANIVAHEAARVFRTTRTNRQGRFRYTYRLIGLTEGDALLYRYVCRRKVSKRSLPRHERWFQWRMSVAVQDTAAGIPIEDQRSPHAARCLYWKRRLGAAKARGRKAAQRAVQVSPAPRMSTQERLRTSLREEDDRR